MDSFSNSKCSVIRWISLTRVSIILKIMSFIVSIDKVRPLQLKLTILEISNVKEWLIKILVRCIFSTIKLWLLGAQVLFYSLRLQLMRTTQRISLGRCTNPLTSVVSSTISKEIREFKLQQMIKSTSIWLIWRTLSLYLKTSCSTSWVAIKWCSVQKWNMESLIRPIRNLLMFIVGDICMIIRYQFVMMC